MPSLGQSLIVPPPPPLASRPSDSTAGDMDRVAAAMREDHGARPCRPSAIKPPLWVLLRDDATLLSRISFRQSAMPCSNVCPCPSLLSLSPLGFCFATGRGRKCCSTANGMVSAAVFNVTTAYLNGVADTFQWFAGSMSSHWRTVQEKELGLIAPVLDPTSPKHGVVARIEVRPGDTVRGSERAEVANMLRKDRGDWKNYFVPRD